MSSNVAPIPSRIILPKGEEMECPSTVKQSLVSMVHPLAGPALVSPDITTAREHCMEASPVTIRAPSDDSQQQQVKTVAPSLALTEGLISSDIKILAPRNSKFVHHVSAVRMPLLLYAHLDD